MGGKIVGVRKDTAGNIAMIRLNDGRVVSLEDAQALAVDGMLDSLTSLDAQGNWAINDGVDGQFESGQNLDMLPEF